MADYTCPNCGGYSKCSDKCPTGGLEAKGRNKLYKNLNGALEAYWLEHRLHGTEVTKTSLQDMIDKAWQETPR